MSDDASPFNPIANIYISYASPDQALLDELLKQLTSLQWESITIFSYHEGQVLAQTEEIASCINSAGVVVMLVSSAYLDSVDRRRWELQQVAAQTRVIAINVSPVNLAASQLKGFCSPLLDYSPVTSWEGQIENLKTARAAIYEVAPLIGSESNFSGFQLNVDLDNDLTESYSPRGAEQDVESRGVERSVDIYADPPEIYKSPSTPTNQRQAHPNYKDVVQFQKQLEQAYRIQEPPQTTAIDEDLIVCSVFSPPAVACGEMFLVQVFVHRPALSSIAYSYRLKGDVNRDLRVSPTSFTF